MASPVVKSRLFEGDARPVITQAILQDTDTDTDTDTETDTVKRLVENTVSRRRGEKYL